jgi:hypothetical protein
LNIVTDNFYIDFWFKVDNWFPIMFYDEIVNYPMFILLLMPSATNQPEEENPGLSLSQCILTCHMKKNCKMVIYDKKIQDCGLISKYYKQKDFAKISDRRICTCSLHLAKSFCL